MTQVTNNSITGISSVISNTDVANKSYVDSTIGGVPSQIGNSGKFLTTTDGTTASWDYVSNYQEFTSPTPQTFTVPNQANLLYIEAIGAGAGGNAGITTASLGLSWYYRGIAPISRFSYKDNIYFGFSPDIYASTDAITWIARTTSTPNLSYRDFKYLNNIYLAGGDDGRLISSTDSIIWTQRTSSFGAYDIYTISYGSNTYIIGGYNSVNIVGTLASSTDGIIWSQRTSRLNFVSDSIYANSLFTCCGGAGGISTSEDGINWTSRTSGAGNNQHNRIIFGNNLYVVGGVNGRLSTSTDSINWTQRTSGFGTSSISSISYGNNLYVAGDTVGNIKTSTDTITWETRTTPSLSLGSFYFSSFYINNLYFLFSLDGRITASAYQAGGNGGSSGSYTSWYIPKSLISSDITIIPGKGGIGATTDNGVGSVGSATTISWTGPGGTYILNSNEGGVNPGAAQTSQSNYFYTTSGGTAGYLSGSVGVDGFAQQSQFQATGGGSGAGNTSSPGGNGGSINFYGNSTFAAGGTSGGTNGSDAVAITGLPYGFGGGGGGASVSIAGTGGNGVRGGGGGGGASIGNTFGNGGNGGDGYVKITWW